MTMELVISYTSFHTNFNLVKSLLHFPRRLTPTVACSNYRGRGRNHYACLMEMNVNSCKTATPSSYAVSATERVLELALEHVKESFCLLSLFKKMYHLKRNMYTFAAIFIS